MQQAYLRSATATLASATVLTLLVSVSVAHGQPKEASKSAAPSSSAVVTPGPEETQKTDAVQSLVNGLRETGDRITRLRQELKKASKDSRALLLPELAEVRSRYRRELVDASAKLTEEKALDTPSPLLSGAVSKVINGLATEGKRIETELQLELRQLVSLLAVAEKAAPEERAAAEAKRNTSAKRTPQLLGELAANLKAREALEQEPKAAHTRLKSWLVQSSTLTGATLNSISEGIKLLSTPNGERPNPDSQERLVALQGFQSLIVSLQRKNLALMDGYEMATTQHRQDLITSTGEVSEDILDVNVLAGLLAQWKSEGVKWVAEKASVVAFKLVSFFVIFFLFLGLAKVGRWLTQRAVNRNPKTSRLAGEFFVKMTGRAILITGVIVAAGQVGFQVGPVLAGLGIAGFVLGFALQDTLSNFASGMMIIMYRPFDVGDVIEAAGAYGTVKAMTLVSTSVLTFDNQMLLVPNNKIWGGVVRNVTHQPTRRVDLSFGIAYSDDIEHAERVLTGIVADNELILKTPAPVVRLHELGDSSVNFVVRPWVRTSDYWPAYWAITREVKRRFDVEGLSFPFPQRDVHVYEEGRQDDRRGDNDMRDGVRDGDRRDSDVVPAQPTPRVG